MAAAIRRAMGVDAEAISSLNAEVQAIHAAALPRWFKPPDPTTFPPSAAAALIARPSNLIFIAEIDPAPAGYIYAEIVRHAETPWRYAHDMVYVHQIGVRAAHRRGGIGRDLLAAVRSAASEAGITLLALDVWSFNKDAQLFFRRCGFLPYNQRLWSW
jgi:ribosomal protein S18 acetylase RimI-like enzyme